MKNLNRRTFLKTTGATVGSLCLTGLRAGEPQQKKRPNILLYVVDDQGSDDAGCLGNPVIKTPGLDALAQTGVTFTNAFCTTASCAASRSVILSGLYSHANGMYGHSHACHHFSCFDNFKSLPVRLSEAGYRTASAGKYHVAPEPVFHFDEYIRGPSPREMADKTRRILADESGKPFFLYFCTNEPHRPFRRGGADPVDPADVIVPPYLPDIPECREELAQYYMSTQRADSGLLRLMELLKETGHWNDTLIVYISDNGIAFPGAKTTLYEPGMRLPCVMRNPFAEKRNPFTEKRNPFAEKRNPFAEKRNPFAEKKGVTSNAMITWADITPTVLDFAGILSADDFAPPVELPEPLRFNDQITKNNKLHGRSVLPVLDEESPAGWDEIYASHTFHEIYMYYPMRVVRERRLKLIWNIAHELEYPFASDLYASKTWQAVLERGIVQYGKRAVADYLRRAEFELYDLETDPDEVVNLADDPEFAVDLERLKKKLKAFQYRTGDPWVGKWVYE